MVGPERDPELEALRRRLAEADPARDLPADPDRVDALIRRTLETPMTESQPTEAPRRTRSWAPLAAAAAAVAVLLGGIVALSVSGGDEAPTAGEPTEISLVMPGSDVTAMCARVEPAFVRNMELVFSGTAVETTEDEVVLDVDRWYHGGTADRVRLTTGEVPITLYGEIDFQQDERYLITASDGRVNICGFSGPWNPELAEVYADAFPEG